jgi:hypothetical protein
MHVGARCQGDERSVGGGGVALSRKAASTASEQSATFAARTPRASKRLASAPKACRLGTWFLDGIARRHKGQIDRNPGPLRRGPRASPAGSGQSTQTRAFSFRSLDDSAERGQALCRGARVFSPSGRGTL